MAFLVETLLFLLSSTLIIIVNLVNYDPLPIFSIYRRRNGLYWFKCIYMYIILSTQKFIRKVKAWGKNKTEEIEELEKPHRLSHHSKAIDAVYFNGANKNGDYLVVGAARRNEKLVDGFLYLLIKDSGLGLLESPKLPGTALYQTEESENYEAEGIKLFLKKPMKTWGILYEGKMKRFENREEVVDVKIEAEWNSDLPYFHFDTDMSPWCLAKSISYELLDSQYFENLKGNHQSHYEQHGDIKGTVTINNRKFDLDINALRDHSFGFKREWLQFHRYGLHFVTTSNGDRFNVGMICAPISFSRLTLGYVYSAEDKEIYPIDWSDFELYQHGQDGKPPVDYAFSFTAGGRMYHMTVNVLHSPHFYISKDWESKIIERLCTFTVNGFSGWGAAEFQYRNPGKKAVADYNGN